MYKRGELQVTESHRHHVDDSRAEDETVKAFHPAAYLPHSCNDWVIGGPEQVKLLIEDLQKALKKMEEE